MTVLVLLNILLVFVLLWIGRDGGQNWFDNQYRLATPVTGYTSGRGPSVELVLKNAEGLLARNGIDLNDPEWKSHVTTPRRAVFNDL